MDPQEIETPATVTPAEPNGEGESTKTETPAPKEETPKAPSENETPEVSAKVQEKYGSLEKDALLVELSKWIGFSRSNETKSRTANETLTSVQTELANVKKEADKATAELATLKAEKAELEISTLRSSLLTKAGLDAETDAVFITGTDEDSIKKQVETLAARVAGSTPEPQQRKNVIPGAGAAKGQSRVSFAEKYRAHLTGN